MGRGRDQDGRRVLHQQHHALRKARGVEGIAAGARGEL